MIFGLNMLVKGRMKTFFIHKNFKKVLKIAKEHADKSLFVFDMDSTLFCMKYRVQAIIAEAFHESSVLEEFSDWIKILPFIEPKVSDWSVLEVLSRYQPNMPKKLIRRIEKIWRKKFFSNDYLCFDRPYKGAPQFLQKLASLKAQIYYLTARNQALMRSGSLLSLKRWNFPLQNESHLIMKKEEPLGDADYKSQELKKLLDRFKILCFFDNEPLILNQVEKNLPEIRLFWIDSTHSKQAQVTKKALVLPPQYSF